VKAKSIAGKSPDEIRTALAQSMADGFRPTLAMVFLSVKQDICAVSEVLDTQRIAIYGTTTNGEFTEAGITKESIAILLLDIDPNSFMILFDEFADRNYREVTRAMAQKARGRFAVPAFFIAGSGLDTDAEELLSGFEDILGRRVNVTGGMAGDDFTFTAQSVFTAGRTSTRGIVAVVLDEEKITIKGRATCGWKPMGTAKTVTRSEGNRIYTIEGIPVLELMKKYSGITDLTSDNPNLVQEMATSLPLQLQREQGDPIMRPGLVVHWEDGSFSCSGSVPQGSKVRFSFPPGFDVIEKVIHGCEELKRDEISEADALIVFSCAGRLLTLGPMIGEEIEGIRKVWNVPMAGMFSNGELARATDGNLELHNLTACCVVLKER
jgi:hypothetical protein